MRCELAEVVHVAAAHVLLLARVLQVLERVVAHCLEHPVAEFAVAVDHGYEPLLD